MTPTVAITGIGETEVGRLPDLSATQLYAIAAQRAAQDAGMDLADIGALVTGNSRSHPFMYHAEALAEYLGWPVRHCETVSTGGATTLAAIAKATDGIALGRYDSAMVVMADSLRSGLGRDAAVSALATLAHPEFEHPYGVTIPGIYALVAQLYVHELGVSPEDMAHVPVSDRRHAALNPAAQYRDPIGVEDVLASRPIAEPLRLLECAPLSDAGCAIVLTAADRAADAPQPPVHVLGFGEAYAQEHVSQSTRLVHTVAKESGDQAFREAGVARGDIDVAMIYDPFSIVMCMFLEDLGFCAKGEGAAFVASGATLPGGTLPTNTHGGLLSHSHSGRASALFLVAEAVKQLRAAAAGRQVDGAELALVHAEGGVMSTQGTMILGRVAP